MTFLVNLTSTIPNCIGVADLGNGTYRVDFAGSSREATAQEISAAQALLDAKVASDAVSATDKADLLEQITVDLGKLSDIVNTESFTNAQRDAALKNLARVGRRLLKGVKAMVL